MIDVARAEALEVAGRVRRRELSAAEVSRAALDRIGRYNDALHAFITVAGERAIREAEAVDKRVADGEDLPLAGVPLAVKDGFWTAGTRTTGGSKALLDHVPTVDATAVARLRSAGCVVVGKAAMHEMAYGFTSENPHFGDCRNPWDPTRIPGGSSGGNAVALATGMALGAIGGDTGGSVRQPSALCGTVGLKVTYGRVSRYGGIPLSWSMDTVGPMTRTVRDAAALLRAMAGHDPKDPTSSRRPVPDYLAEIDGGLKGLRVGIPHDEFLKTMEPEVADAVHEALRVLKDGGARLVEVRLPSLDAVRGAHRAIIFPEASAAHESLLRRKGDQIGDAVRVSLKAGFFLPSTLYLEAQQVRRRLIADFRQAWRDVDLVATPASPIVATPIGQGPTLKVKDVEQPLVRLFLDVTMPFNLTGQPALALPCGFTRAGLPIGLQLVGRPWDEALVLRAGAAYEAATNWHERTPPLDRLGNG